MHIIQIANDEDKKRITRNILEELSEWFGIPEAREEYIRDSAGKVFFCAMENEKDLGFLYLKETGKDTVELAVMGVLEEYHRKGIGKELFNRAKKAAKEMGYSFIQVKTVRMGKNCRTPSVSLHRDPNCHPLVEREWRDPLPLFLGYAGNGMTSLSGGRIFGCCSSGCMALSTRPISR